MSSTAASVTLRAERRLLLATLLVLAAVGWAVVVWQATTTDHGDMVMNGMAQMEGMTGTGDVHAEQLGVDLTMGMAAPLFLAMWVAMMVAMMFPASAPMILAFQRSQSNKRETGADFVPTWVFVAPYLAIWTLFGAAGYLLAVVVDTMADESAWAADNLARVAGGALVLAGIYQLTPLKRVCLSRCRTPLSFMLSYWRDGRGGAWRMGARHGLFCVGCCWALFLLLLPLGVMNVAAMVAVTAVVFAEKVLPAGETVAKVAAVVLIGYGAVAVLVPDVLPTVATVATP